MRCKSIIVEVKKLLIMCSKIPSRVTGAGVKGKSCVFFEHDAGQNTLKKSGFLRNDAGVGVCVGVCEWVCVCGGVCVWEGRAESLPKNGPSCVTELLNCPLGTITKACHVTSAVFRGLFDPHPPMSQKVSFVTGPFVTLFVHFSDTHPPPVT